MFEATPFSPETGKHYINGEWISGGTIRESSNPATGEVLGSYHDADVDVATAAISAARGTFVNTDWARDRELRAKVLWDLASAIEENVDALALAITLENGKPFRNARLEVSIAAPKLRYLAGLALTDLGTAATVHNGSTSMLLREPLGAAGVIVPWNSPAILLVRSLAPALAAGCTAAVKMPAQTALTNSLLAATFAGVSSLPPGVLNMFIESGDAGAKELIASPDIAVVSYTGSTAVGAQIASAAGANLKKVLLELGGKTPMIVFDDADLDAVVPALVAGITLFSGQFCMTGSRILVQDGTADELRKRLVDALGRVEPRPGTEPESRMGPLIDRAAVTRVDKFLLDNEADFVVRGGPVDGPGTFYKPALVAVQDLKSPLIQQEIFGPVATFETFTDEADAIARANASDYGLAASVWTRDGARSLRVPLQIEAGTVWTNAWAQVLDQFEEGGYKKSGIGRLNGPGSLAEFQEVKHIYRSAV